MKIAVACGHTLTGIGSGACGVLNESKCTREVASVLTSILNSNGQSAKELRIDQANPSSNPLFDCHERAKQSNSWGADLYVEIHFNSAGGGAHGTEVLVCSIGGKAEQYAKKVVDSISKECGYSNRGVKTFNGIVLRETNCPAILVECCFVNNPDASSYNPTRIAKAIADGILGHAVVATTPVNNVKIATDYLQTKQNIKNVQKLLQLLGYSFFTIDGICGAKTTAYIGDFQKKHGLGVDYKFGPKSIGIALDIIKNKIK